MKEYIVTEDMIDKKYADANCEELVRCKDCQYWDDGWQPVWANYGEYYCTIIDEITTEDWYCADGERREE